MYLMAVVKCGTPATMLTSSIAFGESGTSRVEKLGAIRLPGYSSISKSHKSVVIKASHKLEVRTCQKHIVFYNTYTYSFLNLDLQYIPAFYATPWPLVRWKSLHIGINMSAGISKTIVQYS